MTDYTGMLINGAVTLFAGACYLYVSMAVYGKKVKKEGKGMPTVYFFSISGAYLLVAGFRQLAAYAGNVSYDKALYYILAAPAAYIVIPLVFLASYVLWGKRNASYGISAFFALAASIGLLFLYLEGISNRYLDYWGSDWKINSVVTRVLLLAAGMVPAVTASSLLIYLGWKTRREDGNDGKRILLVGISALIFYVCFILDAFGLGGISFIAVRIITAEAALIGYVAYFP
ncbi:MAG: hypothetical protein PHH26_04485, partial [Candidatus Thermoplasmatota archaeon]|nr:hypothetical protein [Candidatus Thermoplasmatota archaeon]